MKKVENFYAALKHLQEVYDYEEPYSDLILTGLTAYYEICFEQSWKAMKEILENSGFSESRTGSPKQILKTAFQAGLIHDEMTWLDALVSRNNVAHAYNHDVALDIVRKAKEHYYKMFCDLKEEIDRNWL